MPLNLITFKGKSYPIHQTIGGASLWIRPLAQYYCTGRGLDIGYYKEKWMLPGAIGIEPTIDHRYHAMQLPDNKPGAIMPPKDAILSADNSTGWDFIHSSHCLEHVKENYCNVLDYWLSKIKTGGMLFLYLPHKSQSYWNVDSNRKHVHQFTGKEIKRYLTGLGHKVYLSGIDHNNSFVVIVEKCEDLIRAKTIADVNETVAKYRSGEQ